MRSREQLLELYEAQLSVIAALLQFVDRTADQVLLNFGWRYGLVVVFEDEAMDS